MHLVTVRLYTNNDNRIIIVFGLQHILVNMIFWTDRIPCDWISQPTGSQIVEFLCIYELPGSYPDISNLSLNINVRLTNRFTTIKEATGTATVQRFNVENI